jgi:hypothetical protein
MKPNFVPPDSLGELPDWLNPKKSSLDLQPQSLYNIYIR